VVPNTPYSLQLRAEAFSHTTSTGPAQAFLDPSIYIDPAFPDAGLYSIVLSDGIGNPPPLSVPEAVPEPSSAMLMLSAPAGLLGLGWLRSRSA